MREWVFKSFRPVNPADRFPICRRFLIRRAAPFIGSESAALAFARRACTHLNVVRVEAWATGHSEPSDLPRTITSRIAPHENGKDWQVLKGGLQHPLWIKDLESGIDHMLMRTVGYICRCEVLDKAGRVQWVVLVDQSGHNPFAGTGPTWKQGL